MKKLFYRVQKGDTLKRISLKFSVPEQKLIMDNALSQEVLEGDILYVEKLDLKTYLVRPLDTIDVISKKFGVDKEKILSVNEIDYVYMGQVIYLP